MAKTKKPSHRKEIQTMIKDLILFATKNGMARAKGDKALVAKTDLTVKMAYKALKKALDI
jgi:hypothetical protein